MHDTTEPAAVATALYAALAARDTRAVAATLAEDLSATISSGMPLGVGGHHTGRDAMLRDVWGPVFLTYEVTVDVEEMLRAADSRIVVLGTYRGTIRASGRPMEAAFVHVLTVRDGLITRLVQVTDTVSWSAVPAGGSPDGPPRPPDHTGHPGGRPTTSTAAFGTALIGQTESALGAILERHLAGTGLDRVGWIALTSAQAAVSRDVLESRLCTALKLSPQHAERCVGGLLERKLLSLPADGGGAVGLTAHGRDLHAAIRNELEEVTRRLWGDVARTDLEAAGRLLQLVLARANAEIDGAR